MALLADNMVGLMKSILKFFWSPGILICCALAFAGYMAWKEYSINSTLVEESLKGNRNAIAILAKYEKPWKLNEQIIQGAISGNPYALEVLNITPEPLIQ